jgi:hypothetical protein
MKLMQRLSNSATTIKKAAAAIQKQGMTTKNKTNLSFIQSFFILAFSDFAVCSNIY